MGKVDAVSSVGAPSDSSTWTEQQAEEGGCTPFPASLLPFSCLNWDVPHRLPWVSAFDVDCSPELLPGGPAAEWVLGPLSLWDHESPLLTVSQCLVYTTMYLMCCDDT